MKKLLILISCLLLAVVAQGQMIIRANPNARAQASASAADPYDAVLAAMTVDPTGDTLTWQRNMVYSLDTAGFWDRMDVLYIFAQKNLQGALLNWIDPGTSDCTEVGGSVRLTQYQGIRSDETYTAYLTTNYNPSTDGSNFTLNSGTLGYYQRIDDSSAGYDFGRDDGNNDSYTGGRNGGNEHYSRINASTSNYQTVTDCRGLIIGTRRGSSEVEDYQNGASLGADTDASTALTNADFLLFTHNGTTIREGQISIAFVMDGISDAEATTLNTIFETYMDALGAGVQ